MTAAIDRFEEYVLSGQYQTLKQLEQRQKETREFIRTQLQEEDGRRFEFKDVGYVGRFVRKNKTETNHEALLEELSDYVSVSSMISMNLLNFKPSDDVKEYVEPFALPVDTYVKPTLNSVGKALVVVHKGYYEHFPKILGYRGEISAYANRDGKLKSAEKEYEQLMKMLNSKLTKKTATKYGTLSVINKKPQYELQQIVHEFGETFLLEHCEGKLTKIHELMEMGILERTFLEPFQQVVDVRVDFILQSLESEQKAWDFMQERKKALQQLLAS